MAQQCNYFTDDKHIVGISPTKPVASVRCLRNAGHKGSHLVQNDRGVYVVWEYDVCDNDGLDPEDWNYCEACESDDPEMWCVSYRESSVQEAQKLLSDPRYEGE